MLIGVHLINTRSLNSQLPAAVQVVQGLSPPKVTFKQQAATPYADRHTEPEMGNLLAEGNEFAQVGERPPVKEMLWG